MAGSCCGARSRWLRRATGCSLSRSASSKNGAPAHGLLASGLLVTALVMVDGHGDLVDVFNVIILLGTMTGVVPYAFCTAALLQLLAVRPDEFSPRSRRQLLVIGSLGFAYSLWALYGTGQQAIFCFLVLMAGIPMYTWRQWRNQVNSADAQSQ